MIYSSIYLFDVWDDLMKATGFASVIYRLDVDVSEPVTVTYPEVISSLDEIVKRLMSEEFAEIMNKSGCSKFMSLLDCFEHFPDKNSESLKRTFGVSPGYKRDMIKRRGVYASLWLTKDNYRLIPPQKGYVIPKDLYREMLIFFNGKA